MKKLGIFCLLFMLALSACRDNKDDVITTEDPFVPPIINWTPESRLVNSSLTGFVADEAGEPLANANVKVGNITTTTDDYGHFFLTDVNLNARGTVVTVKKAGYFNGSRRFFAVENQTNRVKIEMLAKSFDYNFNAAAGGTVQTTDGASIVFPPNSIKKADGTIYTGEVKVAAKWLDPSDVQTFDRMPGNLQGVDREVNEVALGTYGMMAVELESAAGEALNISEGNTATLSMPIPASLQGNAPSEIPLWSYNEEHGVWVEEEFKATLTNGKYVGEVSHFSFWNCDYPFPLIEFTANLVDDNGNALSNYRVVVKVNNNPGAGGGTGSGYTCPDGSITGLIPVNMDLTLEVYSICGDILYSQNIGPFADDTDLGAITVSNASVGQTTISGNLVDCNNNPVLNGVVTFEFDGWKVFEYVTDGTFDVSFTTCANTSDITLVGADIDALEQSEPIVFPANSTYDAGDVSACGVDLMNHISITVDDGSNVVSAVYIPSNAFPDSTATGLDATSFSYYDNNVSGTNIYVHVEGNTAGDYSGSNSIFSFTDITNGWNFGQGQSFDSFIIDEYGAVGESINGTFSGTLINYGVQPPVSVTVSGSFDIIRQ